MSEMAFRSSDFATARLAGKWIEKETAKSGGKMLSLHCGEKHAKGNLFICRRLLSANTRSLARNTLAPVAH